MRALSSAGSEHLVYTQRVGGPNPRYVANTKKKQQMNVTFLSGICTGPERACELKRRERYMLLKQAAKFRTEDAWSLLTDVAG